MNQSRFKEMYDRILRGDSKNIKFNDFCDFVEMLGFEFRRQNGTSHRIYKMADMPNIGIINLQEKNGNAKPYQVKQVRDIIRKYKLGGDDCE